MPTKTDLTHRQRVLFEWIEEYIRANKYPPTIREMAKGIEVSSSAPVQKHLELLREKGYLDWEDGRSRTLRLLKTVDGDGK